MVYSILFEQQVDQTTTYKAYDTIQNWVHTQGGKVKENHRPNLIIAAHGSPKQRFAWEKNSRKTMRFELEQRDTKVLVKVHVSPLVSPEKEVAFASRESDARFNWNQLLATLWARFEGGEAIQKETNIAPPSLARSIKRGRRMTTVGTILTVVGLLLSFLSPFPTIIALIASSVGIILMVNGYMAVRAATKQASSRK